MMINEMMMEVFSVMREVHRLCMYNTKTKNIYTKTKNKNENVKISKYASQNGKPLFCYVGLLKSHIKIVTKLLFEVLEYEHCQFSIISKQLQPWVDCG